MGYVVGPPALGNPERHSISSSAIHHRLSHFYLERSEMVLMMRRPARSLVSRSEGRPEDRVFSFPFLQPLMHHVLQVVYTMTGF